MQYICKSLCCQGSFDKKLKVIKDQSDRYVRGLTRTISSDFSPDFCIRDLLKAQPQSKKRKKKKRKLGSILDRQLTLLHEGTRLRKPLPELTYIVNLFRDLGWTIIATQVPLACQTLRLGTVVDLICQTQNQTLVLIELKCGFEHYFYTPVPKITMRYPFQHVVQSCYTKALLQILFTTWLFTHCQHAYKQNTVEQSYLLHVYREDNNQVAHTLNKLPKWLYMDKMFLQQGLLIMKQSKHLNQKKRKQIVRNSSRKARRLVYN